MKTTFWTEPDFQRWSCYAKLLYIYLLTTPRGHGITGTLQASAYDIQHDTGMTPRQQRLGLDHIGYRVRQYADSWLWVVARFRYACLGPKHVAAARNRMKYIPDALAEDFRAVYAESGEIVKPPPPKRTGGYPINGVSIRYPGGIGGILDSENENGYENESESDPATSKSKSTPAVPASGTPRYAPAARDKPSGQPPKPYEAEALHLVDLYGELVKPPSLDTSRSQAKLNILGRLKKGGYDFATLERCIRRYAEHCAILSQEAQFRKNAGNFFGREKVFESFVGGDWQPPKPPPRPAGASRRDDGGSEMGDWT